MFSKKNRGNGLMGHFKKRNMKIRTKVIVLFSILVVFFMSAISIEIYFEKYKMKMFLRDYKKEKSKELDSILILKGATLESVTFDYSFWDEMVDFATSENNTVGNTGYTLAEWAENNINTSLETYNTDAVWIYGRDKKLRYHVADLGNDAAEKCTATLEKVVDKMVSGKEKFCHFFVYEYQAVIEIRGAAIHRGDDVERKGASYGYIFVGLLWDRDYLDSISRFTGENVRILPADHPEGFPAPILEKKNSVMFFKVLEGWNGLPEAYVEAWIESQTARMFSWMSAQLLAVMIMFSFFILAFLYAFFSFWINRPLKIISESLNGDWSRLKDLIKRGDEFGSIAELIDNFFKQKKELEEEVREREKAENGLRETQRQLIQAGKMTAMGHMASGISHELNQPLFIMRGNLQLMGMEEKDAELKNAIETVIAQIDRMSGIITNMSEFARNSEFKFENVDINAPIEDAVDLLYNQLRLDNISLKKYLEPRLPKITGDANQLQQVFVNFITNSWDAINSVEKPGKREITIKSALGEGRDHVEVLFSDTGCGISAENLEYIFNPFFTTKPPGSGMGLGLSIAYSIIERHRGRINVESEPGKGAAFKVIFPVADKVRGGTQK
ncbi:MAG: ATP-binding protein [Candidatus Omnitrophota bacterium]